MKYFVFAGNNPRVILEIILYHGIYFRHINYITVLLNQYFYVHTRMIYKRRNASDVIHFSWGGS